MICFFVISGQICFVTFNLWFFFWVCVHGENQKGGEIQISFRVGLVERVEKWEDRKQWDSGKVRRYKIF